MLCLCGHVELHCSEGDLGDGDAEDAEVEHEADFAVRRRTTEEAEVATEVVGVERFATRAAASMT